MKIEKYDPQKFPDVKVCKWHHVRQSVEHEPCKCELRFVVTDHGKREAYCKHHLAIEMEENVRMRAAVLVQLADMILPA